MTTKLQEAFEKAQQLPPDEQDRLGAWLMHELASEQRWQQSFAKSQDQLAQLANEALAEHRAGKTQPLDPDAI
ncbi:MAG: hypothetical protein CMJ58_14990 [Planctomycetaceae bacterium]|nr:hypothetical protein [Planctomycetaceae bacterium]